MLCIGCRDIRLSKDLGMENERHASEMKDRIWDQHGSELGLEIG